MSGDRHDVDSEIVLPAGMELVVPPPASEPATAPGRGAGSDAASTAASEAATERAMFPPFVHRGGRRQAPAM